MLSKIKGRKLDKLYGTKLIRQIGNKIPLSGQKNKINKNWLTIYYK